MFRPQPKIFTKKVARVCSEIGRFFVGRQNLSCVIGFTQARWVSYWHHPTVWSCASSVVCDFLWVSVAELEDPASSVQKNIVGCRIPRAKAFSGPSVQRITARWCVCICIWQSLEFFVNSCNKDALAECGYSLLNLLKLTWLCWTEVAFHLVCRNGEVAVFEVRV